MLDDFDSNDQFEVMAADDSKKFGLDNFVKALATDQRIWIRLRMALRYHDVGEI